jgi:hypothetical protein
MNRRALGSVAMLMFLEVLSGVFLCATPVFAQQEAPAPQLTNIRIFDPSGQPLKSTPITISLNSQSSSSSSSGSSTDESGGVTLLNFKFGNYSIYVQVENVGYAYVANANVQPAGARPINLRLQRGETLRVYAKEALALAGRKKQTTEYPIGGARVTLALLPPEQPAAVAPDTAGHGTDESAVVPQENRGFSIPAQGTTYDGTGMAVISNIPPGRYAVTVTVLGDYVPATEQVEVTHGSPAELAVYVERASVGGLQVTLQDESGKPLRNKEVSLRVDSSTGEQNITNDASGVRYAHTDAKGTMLLYPLRAGRYTLTAWGRMQIGSTQWGEVWFPSTKVEVAPEGSQITLVVPPTPTGSK